MRRTLIATALAAGIALGGNAVAADATSQQKQDLPFWTHRPCQQEDSVNCHWDAGTSGNGEGHSFIVRAVPGKAHMVCVFYTDRRFARHHDYCS